MHQLNFKWDLFIINKKRLNQSQVFHKIFISIYFKMFLKPYQSH